MTALTACTEILGLGGDYFVGPPAEGGGPPGGGSSPASTTSGGMAAGAGGQGGVGEGAGGGEGGVGATGPITGHRIRYQVDVEGIHDQGYIDLTDAVEAYVEPPPGEEWVAIPGDGSAFGQFTVEGVPDGRYLLHLNGGSIWVWLENRDGVNLDSESPQRVSGGNILSGAFPQLALELTDMTPWEAGDYIQFYSPTTGVYGYIPDGALLEPAISVGATSVSSVADYRQVVFPDGDIDPSDPVLLFHLGQRSGAPYQTLVDYAGDVSIDVPNDSSTVTANVQFQDFDHTNNTFHFHPDVAALTDMALAIHPTKVTPTNAVGAFDVTPLPYELGTPLAGTPDLAVYVVPTPQEPDITMFFGNPFPASWLPWVYVAHDYAASLQIGALPPFDFALQVGCALPPGHALLAEAAQPFVPSVTPPGDPRIDGVSFFAGDGAELLSLTPTIAWEVSPSNPINHVTLRIFEIYDNNGSTWYGGRGQVKSDGSSGRIVVPPTILQPGLKYFFVLLVQQVEFGNTSFDQAPLRLPLPRCFANAISDYVVAPSGP